MKHSVGTDNPRGCAAVRCAATLAAAQKSSQLVCTSAAIELCAAGAAKTKSGTGDCDIPRSTAQPKPKAKLQRYLRCPLAAAAPAYAPANSWCCSPSSSSLKRAEGVLGWGLGSVTYHNMYCWVSKPGRAGPGRAVAQVGAGDAGAEVGGNVKRGRTVAQCTSGAGAIWLPLKMDSCPVATGAGATAGGRTTAAAALAARLAALPARNRSSIDSEQGLGLGVYGLGCVGKKPARDSKPRSAPRRWCKGVGKPP
jgi:hypothetical protein